jgi:hypothetical protein
LIFKSITHSYEYVGRALVLGSSRLSIVNSALLALISFFYIYTVGSYFKINIYILQNHVTYNTFFDFYILNREADHLVIALGILVWFVLSFKGKGKRKAMFVVATAVTWGGIIVTAVSIRSDPLLDMMALIAIPLAVSFVAYDLFVTKRSNHRRILVYNNNKLTVNYLALIGIVTGIISLLISSVTSFLPAVPNLIIVRNYAYDVFVLFSSFSPVLIFLLISCLPLKLLINEFSTKILNVKGRVSDNYPIPINLLGMKTKIIYLSFFMALSIVLVVIPHHPAINRNGQEIGVDTHFYVQWLTPLIQSNSLQEFFQQAFVQQAQGDRPIALIFFFTIAKLSPAGHLSSTIEYIPAILGPALILAVYFLARELVPNNDVIPLLASFLTAVSFHTLIGIYAGFYANWLALIIGYLSFVFLIKYLRSNNKLNLILYSAIIIVLLFTHVYTWSILVLVSGVFLIVMLKLGYYRRKTTVLLLVAVLSSVVIDVGKTASMGSYGGIEREIDIAYQTMGINQFAQRWDILVDVTQNIVGGQFSNFIVLALCLYWLFYSRIRDMSSIFLIIFVSVGLIPLFFGGWDVKLRVFYDIPFQIPAAIALAYIKRQPNGIMLLVPVCLWLVAISVRTVANFYTGSPSQ